MDQIKSPPSRRLFLPVGRKVLAWHRSDQMHVDNYAEQRRRRIYDVVLMLTPAQGAAKRQNERRHQLAGQAEAENDARLIQCS
ncbi:Holliday junction branch migration complex subunit RuvA [Trichinella spiralis]|uniref:Holliday junction branch migration complex subunit RuvA n=1 Tax=Trichinella spiralis TaxID=6334 RepID=A0ABR3KJA3_TRISP